MAHEHPFTRHEALTAWSRIVAGWADHLDPSGARLLIDGVTNQHDAGGSYEGVTRMLWGLGGWLSVAGRETTLSWRGRDYDLLALTREALLAGTDPASPGYWGVPSQPGSYDQRTVESGQVAFAVWQSRRQIWDTLNAGERQQIVQWLDACGQRPPAWRNNWALFWALNHTVRAALDVKHDPAIVPEVLDYLDGVYCGNGWYDDGAVRGANHFDDYNIWVFVSHVLAWARIAGDQVPERRDLLLERVRAQMEHLPWFFAANGAYTEYGRSLSYKFARLGGPVWAYQQGAWPHEVGMLKRLVGRHLRWYLDRGGLRADGTLSQALTSEGSLAVREPYISTGATYWAMQAFGALWSLADDDPFWDAGETPLPVEQGDFTRVMPEPGVVLVGTTASGDVQRFVSRSAHMPAKYSKFHYTTAAPFNVGLVEGHPAADAMLSINLRAAWGHKHAVLASAVGEPGWLRYRHVQTIRGADFVIETVIVTHGEQHLRLHVIESDGAVDASIRVTEGAAAFGFPEGALPETGASIAPAGGQDAGAGALSPPAMEPVWSWVSDGARTVAIAGITGYTRAELPTAFGNDGIHSVSGKHLTPVLEASPLVPGQVLAAVVHIGSRLEHPEQLGELVRDFTLQDDGSWRVTWSDGTAVQIPALEIAE